MPSLDFLKKKIKKKKKRKLKEGKSIKYLQ